MGSDVLGKMGIGLITCTVVTAFFSVIVYLIYYIGSEIVRIFLNLRNWINLSIIEKLISIFVFIIVLGIILFLIGEIKDIFITKYPPVLYKEEIRYTLTEKEKEGITVIIPAYNEEKTIEDAIKAVKPYCENVIVINDGSADRTKEIAEKNGAILVNHKINQGLGKTLRDGVKKALEINSKIIINFDADLQYNASDIPKLIYMINEQDCDLAMGSRLGGTIEKMSIMKKIGNKAYTRLLQYLTKVGISDGQSGFRAFTAEFASKIKIRGDFTYTQEMILEAANIKAKIGEIPIYFAERKSGCSRLMKNPFHFAKESGVFLLKVLIDLYTQKSGTLISLSFFIIVMLLAGIQLLSFISFQIYSIIAVFTIIILGSTAFLIFYFIFVIEAKTTSH